MQVKKHMWLLFVFITSFSQVSYAANTNVEFLNQTTTNKTLPFSEAVKLGNILFLSGQIGFSPQTNKLIEGGFSAQTEQTLRNIKTSLGRYGHKMKDVIKCTVILTDMGKFAEFNRIYKQHFSFPYPTRTTFAVAELALGAQIEIECMAAK